MNSSVRGQFTTDSFLFNCFKVRLLQFVHNQQMYNAFYKYKGRKTLGSFFKKYEPYLAHALTIIGLFLVFYQLHQSNEHKKWENYNAMNLRYYEWYSSFPENIEVDSCLPFDQQPQRVKRWVRTYFNLYSEEYWLYLENLIPEDMWKKRIDNGVNVNLEAYPILVRGYYYWKEKQAFKHPDTFLKVVDAKLASIKPHLKLLDCDVKQPSSINLKSK